MATVYMGPLGSTQEVIGGGGGGGGLKTIFAQSPGPVTYPGDGLRHSLFGPVAFTRGAGASDFCVDFFAAFGCTVATFADSQFTIEADLDAGGFVSLQGTTIATGAGLRVVTVGGVACLPPLLVPPGPHVLEWFIVTPVDLEVLTGTAANAFAMTRGFWTE